MLPPPPPSPSPPLPHGIKPRQAGEPLASFLDYCTYGHMIDNVVLIVTGTLHDRDVQVMRAGGEGGLPCAASGA